MNRQILQSVNDVIIIVTPQGIIEEASDSISDSFFYDKEEVIGKRLEILIPERFRANHAITFKQKTKAPIRRIMGNGEAKKFLGLAKNGNEFHVDIALSSYENDQGEHRYIAVIRDITRLIDTQQELEYAVAKLEQKNQELESFAYMISHDLKSPVNSTMQLITLIEDYHQGELNEHILKYFELIKDSNKRMYSLIEGVLNYARAGTAGLEKVEIDLHALLEEVVEGLHIPKGFNVTYHNSKHSITTHKTQLSQVLANLIGNAIKYHDKQEGLIDIHCTRKSDYIEITIKDDGPGIHPKYHSHIFKMFGTANEIGRKDSTGIGLTIVKKIVEKNNGDLKLNSELGKGSEFIFTWKLE